LIRRLVLIAVAVASFMLPLTGRAADTIDVGGAKLEATAQLGNARLQLNGSGVRYKAVFKVYAAGLYLTTRATTTEAVLASNGPRRMHIVMLREIDANELGKLFTRSMEQNTSREEFSKVIPGVIKMSDIFSQRKKLAATNASTRLTRKAVRRSNDSETQRGNAATGTQNSGTAVNRRSILRTSIIANIAVKRPTCVRSSRTRFWPKRRKYTASKSPSVRSITP